MHRPQNDGAADFEALLARAASQIAVEQADEVRQKYENAPEVGYSQAFLSSIEEMGRDAKRKKRLIFWNRVAKRAAMILIVVVTALTAALSVKGVRAQLYEYFVTHNDEYTQVQVAAADEGFRGRMVSEGDYHYEPSFVPARYILREKKEEYDFFYHLEYVDKTAYAEFEQRQKALIEKWGSEDAIPEQERIYYDGPFLLFEEQRSIEGSVIFDTEDAVYKELELDGSPAYLALKNGRATLIWDNGDRAFMLFGQLSEEEILRVARSVARVEE